MQFLILTLIVTLAAWALPASAGGRSLKVAMRRGMGVAFIFVGVSHFVIPASFLVYLPDWVPARELVIYATGVVEVIAGIALFAGRYLPQVGLAIARLSGVDLPGERLRGHLGGEATLPGLIDAWWYPWVRLPFQVLFIWWALYCTDAMSVEFQESAPWRTKASVERAPTASSA